MRYNYVCAGVKLKWKKVGKMKLIKVFVMKWGEEEWEIIETQRGMKNKHNL